MILLNKFIFVNITKNNFIYGDKTHIHNFRITWDFDMSGIDFISCANTKIILIKDTTVEKHISNKFILHITNQSYFSIQFIDEILCGAPILDIWDDPDNCIKKYENVYNILKYGLPKTLI